METTGIIGILGIIKGIDIGVVLENKMETTRIIGVIGRII